MKPPLIGLPGRRKRAGQIQGFSPALGDIHVDVYLADFARGVLEAGGIPVHLPLDVAPEVVGPRLDGVLLSGGTDIDPERYGADPHPELLGLEPERDEFELRLFSTALESELPVLGICRGLQIINVHQGGTLHQHVGSHSRYDMPFDDSAHPVRCNNGSMLHRLYGDTVRVNSLHHQTVAALGDDLEITAQADDGVIEGLEMGDRVLAVQWHPEFMPGRAIDPLFGWLVDEASR